MAAENREQLLRELEEEERTLKQMEERKRLKRLSKKEKKRVKKEQQQQQQQQLEQKEPGDEGDEGDLGEGVGVAGSVIDQHESVPIDQQQTTAIPTSKKKKKKRKKKASTSHAQPVSTSTTDTPPCPPIPTRTDSTSSSAAGPSTADTHVDTDLSGRVSTLLLKTEDITPVTSERVRSVSVGEGRVGVGTGTRGGVGLERGVGQERAGGTPPVQMTREPASSVIRPVPMAYHPHPQHPSHSPHSPHSSSAVMGHHQHQASSFPVFHSANAFSSPPLPLQHSPPLVHSQTQHHHHQHHHQHQHCSGSVAVPVHTTTTVHAHTIPGPIPQSQTQGTSYFSSDLFSSSAPSSSTFGGHGVSGPVRQRHISGPGVIGGERRGGGGAANGGVSSGALGQRSVVTAGARLPPPTPGPLAGSVQYQSQVGWMDGMAASASSVGFTVGPVRKQTSCGGCVGGPGGIPLGFLHHHQQQSQQSQLLPQPQYPTSQVPMMDPSGIGLMSSCVNPPGSSSLSIPMPIPGPSSVSWLPTGGPVVSVPVPVQINMMSTQQQQQQKQPSYSQQHGRVGVGVVSGDPLFRAQLSRDHDVYHDYRHQAYE